MPSLSPAKIRVQLRYGRIRSSVPLRQRVNVAVAYVFPQVQFAKYFPLAKRFADTWRQFPPGNESHTLYVIGNGGEVPPASRGIFHYGTRFVSHDNSGWDIGGFQSAADHIPCDLLVCLGAPVHFHRAGWLDRMVDAFLNHGPALYGCACYEGALLHVRTTIFWCPPQLLQSYPMLVGSTRPARYDFEHGPHSFTRHTLNAGLDCIMATWQGVFPYDGRGNWQNHMPDADTILVRDQHIHR